MSLGLNFNANAFTQKFRSFFFAINANPVETKDYYEARSPGHTFIRPQNTNLYGSYNSDTNKKISFNFSSNTGLTPVISPSLGQEWWYGFGLSPNYRVSNRLSFNFSTNVGKDNNDRGWVDSPLNGTIVFGKRDVFNVTNVLGASFVLTNHLSFSLRVRHYWARASYKGYYDLNPEGRLNEDPGYTVNQDFNVNIFNIDAGIIWWFAPGSSMNLLWKNAISTGDNKLIYNYDSDFNRMLNSPQLNTVSLKVIYYFDFLYLRRQARTDTSDRL
jgi:hypothetical protein